MFDYLAANIDQLILMGVLLVLSGFCSGSETALFSLSPADLNRLRRKPSAPGAAILFLNGRLPEFLLTVLLLNNIVNIFFFAVSSVYTAHLITTCGAGAGAAFGVITLILLILCGEVLPKIIASAASYYCSILAALPMAILHRLLWPVRLIMHKVIHCLERAANIQSPTENAEEELKLLFELGKSKGELSTDENDLLTGVVELPEIRAGEIMTPRVDAVALALIATREEALEVAGRCRHSKLPVRDRESEEFIGWLDAREAFFRLQPGEAIARLVRKPLFLSEFDKGDQILRRFLDHHARLAVVLDERGATAGILALSDLAAEIFGELGDEEACPEEPVRQESENAWLLDGRVSVRELRNLFHIEQDFPAVQTVSGLMAAQLGRPARDGDWVEVEGLELSVAAMRKKRVGKVRVVVSKTMESMQEGKE